jgi:hypothetical protein
MLMALQRELGSRGVLPFDLVQFVIVLVVVGLVWWLIETYVPIAAPIKVVIRVIVVLVLCVWLLRFAGIV